MFNRLIAMAALFVISLSSAHAQMVDKNDLSFTVDPEILQKGEVHYAMKIFPRRDLKQQMELRQLDGARFLKRKDVSVQLIKLAYLVDKPAGFFSSGQMSDPQWLQTLLGGSVKTIQEDTFETQARGKLRVYFDSDDLSSVRTSRFVHAVAQSKKLDPIALGGFSTFVMHSADMVELHNHIPFTPKKTLVVSYYLNVVKNEADEKKMRLDFIKETEARLSRAYP